MPVEVVTTVKLKDEWVVDLRMCPHLTIQTEKKEKEQTEKIASVNLYLWSRFAFSQVNRSLTTHL